MVVSPPPEVPALLDKSSDDFVEDLEVEPLRLLVEVAAVVTPVGRGKVEEEDLSE